MQSLSVSGTLFAVGWLSLLLGLAPAHAQNRVGEGRAKSTGEVTAVRQKTSQLGQPRQTTAATSSPARSQLKLPPGFPISKQHEDFVVRLLHHWEKQSAKIERYRCGFTRYEYNPVLGPGVDAQTGVLPARTKSFGQIMYAAPDKGLFRVDEVTHYRPGKQPGGKAQYVKHEAEHGEHWVCDGVRVFEFRHHQKELVQIELPPEMHGKGIVDGPLPFLFGAEAQKILDRYWVHTITPKDAAARKEYWLEVFPKSQADVASYRMVHVIIDKYILPKAIRIFAPNYHPKTNRTSTLFVFDDREQNWSTIPEKLNLFHRAFHKPKMPDGWKLVPYTQSDMAATRNASRASEQSRPAERSVGSQETRSR